MTPLYILVNLANIALLVAPVTSSPLPKKTPKAPKFNLAAPEARYGPLAAEPVPISIDTWLHTTPLVAPGSDVRPPITRPRFNMDHADGVASWLETVPMDLANQIQPLDVGGPKIPGEYIWDLSHSPNRQKFDNPYEIPDNDMFGSILPGVNVPELMESNGYSRFEALDGLPTPLTKDGKVDAWLNTLPDMPSSVIEANLPADIDITHTGFGNRFMADVVEPTGWGSNIGDYDFDLQGSDYGGRDYGYDYNQEGNYRAVYDYDIDYSPVSGYNLDFSTDPATSTFGGAWGATTSALGGAWDTTSSAVGGAWDWVKSKIW
jgi:hypothetical protein